jgi:hypothetical protein
MFRFLRFYLSAMPSLPSFTFSGLRPRLFSSDPPPCYITSTELNSQAERKGWERERRRETETERERRRSWKDKKQEKKKEGI